MKNIIGLLGIFLFSTFSNLQAQDTIYITGNKVENYKKRSPIYDYSEKNLNNTDTIPGYLTQNNKLKITGTIYESDGVTIASNVLLFIEQSDENGDFQLRKYNKKRYVKHRGWVRTDDKGQYKLYTFIPGSSMYGNDPKQIHPILKEPNKPAYKIEPFLFDDDPRLTDKCRELVEQTNPRRILKLDKKEGVYVTTRDIILGEEVAIK
ncbi:hypothetical protein Q4566_04650 [Tamlana sp. 2_MG-2023]|uniref:hypothetical protein n=1 Tax=unclassified Tamlana TaxID=2614803 RepID=UPI0026E16A45|nr:MULTISPECIES: hypothetical protein [unclassified Tamlana]MDO6759481.1 hypothetical protein [Tamlana sp. 2_MG-2023]MDO6790380.1 hypothetical protein [Tamlana sp. 1_MG-2023]